jgi:diguanylate cyclase (GGDEF)-like protein/PAS domain S-box-containing protein
VLLSERQYTEDIALTWQFTSEVLIAILATAIALLLSVLSWRWWKTPGVLYYALLMIAVGSWAIFSGLEIASIPILLKILWAKMQIISIAFIAVFWFLFVLQYTHQDKKIAYWWVILLVVIPAMTIYVAITEDQHHWLWQSVVPSSNAPGAPLIFTIAWWYLVSAAYFYLQVVVGVLVLIRRVIIPPRHAGARGLLLLSGIIPPLVCNLIYQTQLLPINNISIMIMIGLVISGLIYFWGIYYFQTLEYSSLSRDVIIDNMSEGVIVLDRKDRIYNINSTALSMLGMSQRSARRKTLKDIIAIWPGIAETFRVPRDYETEVKINGDAPKILNVRTTNLKDRDGHPTGRMVVWWDITQYRQVEETLRDSEARFKALFQGAPDAIIITDKINRILLANNQAITLFGYSMNELADNTIDLVIPERYLEAYYKYQKAFIDEIDTRPGISLPLYGVRKNKREIPIEIALSPVKIPSGVIFTNIIRDLTIRREAEQQLRLQSVALESAANGIIITDRNGNIQWVNPAFTKMTGYSADEVVGKNPRIQKSGLVPQETYNNLWRTILSGNVWHGELINQKKDGSIITEEQTIAPVKDSSGQIIHFIAIKQDITERKQTEEALSNRSDQIATLNRVMRSLSSSLDLSKVLDMILHEIQQVIPYDSASIWLCKDDNLEIIAAHGFANSEALIGKTFDLSSKDNPNIQVIRTRMPLIESDISTAYLSLQNGNQTKNMNRGWMGVPMIIGDRVIGMLAFDKNVPDFYTQEQSQFALAFAAQAGIAIENARLYSDAQKELMEKIEAEEKLLKLQKELEEQAIRDSLTGLYNRRFLDETLTRELSRAERDKYSVSVVMLDLDHFKNFNDSYGHDVGDLMLKQLGKLLTSQVRAGDIACRYGGEEFVVVMPKASLSVARQRANDWRIKFESLAVEHEGEVLNATLSAGVAVFPLHGTTGDEVIRRADQAMYEAKNAGRNQVHVAQ